jgi:hypothetical protein
MTLVRTRWGLELPGAMGVCKHEGECEHRIHW